MSGSTTVQIAGKNFVCVRLDDADFNDVAAVYVILCVASDGTSKVLDVGQSGQVGTRIDQHDRRECWEKNCPSKNLWVCVYQMPSKDFTKEDREEFEHEIREAYGQLPCGLR